MCSDETDGGVDAADDGGNDGDDASDDGAGMRDHARRLRGHGTESQRDRPVLPGLYTVAGRPRPRSEPRSPTMTDSDLATADARHAPLRLAHRAPVQRHSAERKHGMDSRLPLPRRLTRMDLGEDLDGSSPRGRGLRPSVGCSTAFPVSMARGAAFDVDLEYAIGEAIGDEMQAAPQDLAAGAVHELLRHPLGAARRKPTARTRFRSVVWPRP